MDTDVKFRKRRWSPRVLDIKKSIMLVKRKIYRSKIEDIGLFADKSIHSGTRARVWAFESKLDLFLIKEEVEKNSLATQEQLKILLS